LVWLVVILIAFAAGFLLNYFLLYQPINAERIALEGQLEETTQAFSQLETENSRLSTQLDQTKEALESATANALYYQLLVDVNQARVKLFMEDIEGAQESLVTTQDTLQDLLPVIESIDADLALSLPRRLDLIVSGIARDPETGMIDLELFTLDLLALEPLLISD
jgi:predicted  nucleic acid-binding Zn-ribbon protein